MSKSDTYPFSCLTSQAANISASSLRVLQCESADKNSFYGEKDKPEVFCWERA